MQSLARGIALARARAKTVFSHLNQASVLKITNFGPPTNRESHSMMLLVCVVVCAYPLA